MKLLASFLYLAALLSSLHAQIAHCATKPSAASTKATAPAPSIIVIGAGVAGLKAAADLAAKGYAVTVLESRDRTGGRIWTVTKSPVPIELGAQWIHGSESPIL